MNNALQLSHITKTAGSSIEASSKKNNISWGVNNQNLWKLIQKHTETRNAESWHTPLSFVTDDFLIELKKTYNFFCIVRNPYERAISEYYCRFGSIYFFQKSNISINELGLFNRHLNNGLLKIRDKFQNNNYHHLAHWQKQHFYFLKNKKLIIDKSHILKFENLQTEFDMLLKQYNIILPLTERISYAICDKFFGVADLNKENICLINEIYYEDFIQCGYQLL